MKKITYLLVLLFSLAFMSTSCKKEDVLSEEGITFNKFFSGSWELTECKTNNVLTPCGTILYPFIIHSDMPREIVLYTKIEFDTINDKISTTNCNNENYLLGHMGGTHFIIDGEPAGVGLFSTNFSPWGRFTPNFKDNSFQMDIVVEYVWASMVAPFEYVSVTHICKFVRIDK